MSLIGLIDKFLNNKFKLGECFDSGAAILGEMMVFVMGIYCFGVTISSNFLDVISSATANWIFDPAVLIGSVLAPDMGSYPVATTIAASPEMGHFSGVAVGSTIGTLISFYLPAYISSVKGKDIDILMEGFLYGIVVLPITLIISGLLYGIGIGPVIKNLCPVLVLCLLLFVGLLRKRDLTTKLLYHFGKVFTVITYFAFVVSLLSLFFPEKSFISASLVETTIVMIFKMTINIIGALVTMEILKRIFSKQFAWAANKLGINEYSMMGILVGIPGGIAMIPLLPKMDHKGKILNGAFAVSGFYALGGQMALVAANETSSSLMIFFFAKLGGGLLAMLLAANMEKAQ